MTAGLAMSFRSFLGPAFNVIISLQNMRIAMETNQAIMRSLNDVVLAGEHAYKNNMGVVVQNTMQYRLYRSVLNDVLKTEKLLAVQRQHEIDVEKGYAITSDAQLQKAKKRLEYDFIYIDILNKRTNAQKKAKYATDDLTTALRMHDAELNRVTEGMKNRAQRIATYETQVFKENAAAEQQKIRNLQEIATRYNKASYAASLFGMALMAQNKSEKLQRAGMFLNMYAMGLQIAKQVVSRQEKNKDTAATLKNTIARKLNAERIKNQTTFMKGNYVQRQANNVAVGINTKKINFSTAVIITEKQAMDLSTAAVNRNTASKTVAAAAASRLTAAVTASASAIYASLGPLGILAIGIGALAFAFKDAKQSIDDFNVSMADFTEATDIAKTHDIDQIKSMIREQEEILEDLEGATSAEAIADRQKAQGKLETFKAALNKEISMRDDLAEAIQEQAANEKMLADAKEKYPANLLGVRPPEYDKIKDEYNQTIKDMRYKYGEDVLRFFEENSIESLDELNKYVQRSNQRMASSTSHAIDSMTQVVNAGSDALYNFGNAREELFYGFSASNVTGDLIRQVNQQGVETLITTTEVIMTNNFNGMTVPEVADQIIDEIESRGNLNGFNFATAG